jgi:hypothetical protein
MFLKFHNNFSKYSSVAALLSSYGMPRGSVAFPVPGPQGRTTLSNSMQHISPWQANTPSGSQEIFRILRKPKAHHRFHNNPTPVPILSQINPVHTPNPVLKDPVSYLPQSTPPSKWCLSPRFLHQTLCASLLSHTRSRTTPMQFNSFYSNMFSQLCWMRPLKSWKANNVKAINRCPFLGRFAKFRKATRVSVRPHGTIRLP